MWSACHVIICVCMMIYTYEIHLNKYCFRSHVTSVQWRSPPFSLYCLSSPWLSMKLTVSTIRRIQSDRLKHNMVELSTTMFRTTIIVVFPRHHENTYFCAQTWWCWWCFFDFCSIDNSLLRQQSLAWKQYCWIYVAYLSDLSRFNQFTSKIHASYSLWTLASR